MKNANTLPLIAALAGSLLVVFVSWEWNSPLAMLLSYTLLIYGIRRLGKWVLTIPFMLIAIGMKVVAMHGGWEIEPIMEIVFGTLVNIPLIAGLYLDRAFHKRLKTFMASLVFPATYVSLDFLISLLPIGMVFSIPYVVSRELVLIQASSLLGSWFVGFVVMWMVSAINEISFKGMDREKGRALLAIGLLFLLVFGYGSARLTLAKSEGSTVRVGSISVEQVFDAWGITDRGTPREEAAQFQGKMTELEEELFRLSQKAVDSGAKIVFWSEGNGVMYEDHYEAFLQRASEFALRNQVWFMPGILVLHYGQTWNENLAVMLKPDGTLGFRYEKTKTWYPSQSDGIIKTVDTPYGRIASAICFDMDFPQFIRQATDADIILVPAYDTEKITPFHSESALLRGVENGFSVIRQCNHGASLAADAYGNILTSQNYFTTPERLMMSDVPIKGIFTLYGVVGDIFAWMIIGLWFLILMLPKSVDTFHNEAS